jgi:hypothetical protein
LEEHACAHEQLLLVRVAFHELVHAACGAKIRASETQLRSPPRCARAARAASTTRPSAKSRAHPQAQPR